MNESAERELWTGHPSQFTAFGFYLLMGVIGALLITATVYASSSESLAGIWYYPLIGVGLVLFAALIKYFLVRTTTYRLTNERLVIEEGVFSRATEEIELYRVKDWSIVQPLWLRMLGRGHVHVLSTDTSAPDIYLSGIIKPEALKDLLRTNVEAAREKKRVRHVDVE